MKKEPLPVTSRLPKNETRLVPKQRVGTRLLDDAQLGPIGRHGMCDETRAAKVSKQQADGDKRRYDEQGEHDFRVNAHKAIPPRHNGWR
jgi:hypothetical protein